MKTIAATLATIAFLLLLAGVQASHAYTESNDPPWANFASGSSHPLIFAETVFSSYGTESDNSYGTDQFSFQLNGEASEYYTFCSPFCLSYWEYYNFQSFVQFSTNTFTFTPQIWTSINGGTISESWHGTTSTSGLNVPTSQLSNYEIFEGVNDGSSGLTVTVSGCNVSITLPAASMYAGVLKLSTCTVVWSNTQTFSTSYEVSGGFSGMQTGELGYASSSSASFTGTVIYGELFEYNCAFSGCSYNFANNNSVTVYTTETSNLKYIANANSGGYHVNECSESPDKSVC